MGVRGGQERAWGGACQVMSLLVAGLGHPIHPKERDPTILIRVLL